MEKKQIELNIEEIKIIDERLNDYYSNPNTVENFDDMLDEIEESLINPNKDKP